MLDELMNSQSAVRDLYGRAVGYAVFTVTKGGFIVSGGGGNGVAVDKSTGSARTCGWARRHRARYRRATLCLVMLFETEDRLDKFVAGGWDSRATAEAAAGKEGIAVQSSFFDGVAFYQITEKGLMAHADVSGTKFWVNDELR